MGTGDVLDHESIVGTLFRARIVEQCSVAGRAAVIPEVTGMAHRTGTSEFVVDPSDEVVPGFVLR